MSGLTILKEAIEAGAAKAKPLRSMFDEALANIQRPKGTGMEFLTEVSKQPGVKKAEIEDRKLKQAFEGAGKITKEQAQALAKKYASPKIQEKVLTEQGEKFSELEKMAERDYGQAFEDLHPSIQDELESEFDAAAAQYGEYRMPGGTNYREIILKLPSMPDADKERLMQLEAQHRRLPQGAQWSFEEGPEGKEMKALKEKAQQSAYYSSHWGKDEANPLAHMRVQDRVGPNGEKILHVEEIQSDWHQAGRKKGYGPKIEKSIEAYYETKDGQRIPVGFGKTKEEADASIDIGWRNLVDIKYEPIERKIGEGVPDAPFKKNWHELAMKRLINHAAENGYDKIAITPGAEQADRYSLAKKLKDVHFDPSTGHLAGRDHEGKLVVAQQGVNQDNLADYIGKEGAQKILAATPDNNGIMTLSGVDLQVGGEGMKGFYDKMLPDYLNTFGKKYGAQVGAMDFEVAPAKVTPQVAAPGIDYFPEPITEPAQTKRLHTFDITPQLREEITTKGMPLYQQIGMPLGAGAAGSEIVQGDDAQGFAQGGMVGTPPTSYDPFQVDQIMSSIDEPRGYKEGGGVDVPDIEFDDPESMRLYKHAMKQTMGGNDFSTVATGVNAQTGGGNLSLGVDFNRMSNKDREDFMHNLAANYNIDLGDLNVNARVQKPLGIPDDVYVGMLNGSLPVGGGRATFGVQGVKTPYGRDITGYNAGWSGQVGEGRLNANVMQPKGNRAGRAVQVQYQVPFAEGGSVSAYDPRRVDAIVNQFM